ncbi:hypothetical protein QBC34DRAFT_381210 [Podospora aff. communis PSN243]|uniref:Hypervirulence associated protein TUDOR domain-containing protein n=1 Tax=Podospora aff. communis PSN243 TaxID=3040156 RepID=A0AAV9GHS0_9PEZI|nr:hypothetical protein QBC34DRAFT_381210 [Podospora aff. communis PSN243]
MANETELEGGDQVSWNLSGGAPGGTVTEKVTEGELATETQRGNTVEKNANPENPALRMETSVNDVVKHESEVTVGSKAAESSNKMEKKESGDIASKEKGNALEGKGPEGKEVGEETWAQDPEGTEDEGDEKVEEHASGEEVREKNAELDKNEVNAAGKKVEKDGNAASREAEAETERKDADQKDVGPNDAEHKSDREMDSEQEGAKQKENDAEDKTPEQKDAEKKGTGKKPAEKKGADGEVAAHGEQALAETNTEAPAQRAKPQPNEKKRKAASVCDGENEEALQDEHTAKRVKRQSIS